MNLDELCTKHKIDTWEALAAHADVSLSTVMRAAAGSPISKRTARRISHVFGIEPEEIAGLQFRVAKRRRGSGHVEQQDT